MDTQITKEIESAIDAAENIGHTLLSMKIHIGEMNGLLLMKDVEIAGRDKVIAHQEQEIFDLKEQLHDIYSKHTN